MIDQIINFARQFAPLSAFLYGSQATGEARPASDYEVGLVFDDNHYVSRREIKAQQTLQGVSFYPFRLSELESYTLDTPFPKKLFVEQLITSGKTISGREIIAQLKPPKITKLDLVGAIRFEIGVAFCSFLTLRRGDRFLAIDEFSKSCLHGLKLLLRAATGGVFVAYKEIYEHSKTLELPDEYRAVIDAAYRARQTTTAVDDNYIYKNMSFLGYVEQQILALQRGL